jgi:hypothetical protein
VYNRRNSKFCNNFKTVHLFIIIGYFFYISLVPPSFQFQIPFERTTLSRMSSLVGRMNIARVNIGFFTGFKKIKQRRIFFVLAYSPMIGFSKHCVKIQKRCYTDLFHFSTRKHNLVSLFGRIVF